MMNDLNLLMREPMIKREIAKISEMDGENRPKVDAIDLTWLAIGLRSLRFW